MPNPLKGKSWADLKQAWEDYGFNVSWDNVLDAKVRSDWCYVVFAVRSGKDEIEMIDFAKGGEWEVQNDGSDSITQAQWDKLKIVPECDWYEYPDEDQMKLVEHEELVEIENTKYRDAFLIFQEGYEAAFGGDKIVEKWVESEAYKAVMAKTKKKGKK